MGDLDPKALEAAANAFVANVREQDAEWTREDEEGEILVVAPNGDFFAVEYAVRDAVQAYLAATPPAPPAERVELVRKLRAGADKWQALADEYMGPFESGPLSELMDDVREAARILSALNPTPTYDDGIRDGLERAAKVAKEYSITAGFHSDPVNLYRSQAADVIEAAILALIPNGEA